MVHEHLVAIYLCKLSHCKQDLCLIYRSAAKAQLQLADLPKIKEGICGRVGNQIYVFWIAQAELNLSQVRQKYAFPLPFITHGTLISVSPLSTPFQLRMVL